MKTILRLVTISVSILFITGCVSIIPLDNIDDHTIVQELSEQQVKEAVHTGIETAGWTVENEAAGKILATYTVRVHTIAVNIRYTEKNYSINYAYSINMKVHCTDKHQGEIFLTNWPEVTCDGARPAHIHSAYNEWVENLNSEINTALSSN
ncbi:MAG: hypothetical protein V3R32_03400 [Nitrosomonadaceae bacterium]